MLQDYYKQMKPNSEVLI